MKLIKIAFYQLESKRNRDRQSNMIFKTFDEMLKDLATKLDGNENQQLIETDKNGLETSIWFDYINEKEYFDFKDNCYFLLAKDVLSIMKEDKRNNELVHQNVIDDDIHLKIPAHFMYFPKNNILAVEEIGNTAPTKSVIERAIKNHIHENIKFVPIHREDVVERLSQFLNAVNSVEFDMKEFSNLIKDTGVNDFTDFLINNNSKLKIRTYLDTDSSKKYVFDLFSKLFNKSAENEILARITNMSVKYKNEEQKQEALSLIDNYLTFKKESDVYLEELQNMEDNTQRRLKYSKSIYQIMIDVYNEYYS